MGFSFMPPPPPKVEPKPDPTGNAQPGDVRSGKGFSNSDGINKTGTLPVASTSPLIVTPTNQDQEKPAGIYDGPITVKGVTVPASKVLSDTTIAGVKGTMTDRGAVTITPTDKDQSIPSGYHNGNGVVKGASPYNYTATQSIPAFSYYDILPSLGKRLVAVAYRDYDNNNYFFGHTFLDPNDMQWVYNSDVGFDSISKSSVRIKSKWSYDLRIQYTACSI